VTEPRGLTEIRAAILERVGEDYPVLGLLVDLERAAVEAKLAELRAAVGGLPRYDETLDTLTDDDDGAPQHLGVYDPNAVYVAAVLRLLEPKP